MKRHLPAPTVMSRPSTLLPLAALALLLPSALAACMESTTTRGPEGRLSVQAAALSLDGVTNARWRITVENGADPRQLVWTAEVDADRYGDGQSAITYIGPCDASEDAREHRVTVELLALYSSDDPPTIIPASTWRNPGPISRPATCLENRDTLVEFNLTILRNANQGFFDIAVNFDEVFCSAKLDCQESLLHYPANDPLGRTGRGPTAVIAFACTAGQTSAGAARPSHLYLDPVRLVCPDRPDVVVRPMPPKPGGGNLGAVSPAFFQTAVYLGKESLPDLNKCYWNLALGLEEAVDGCRLQLTGTASSAPLANGTTPDNAVYPAIFWDVPLSGTSCGVNPLDGPASGVRTDYLTEPRAFPYQLTCDDEPTVETFARFCIVESDPVALTRFSEIEGLVTVERGGVTPFSAPLAQGLSLAGEAGPTGCCMDPCCGGVTSASVAPSIP